MGQVGEANATPPEGQPSPWPWSLCWERRPARWTPQAPDSGREPADVSARTRPSRTCPRHHLRALGGASTPAPPLRQSPQEGPGPSDAQWRRGQTRVLQKLRAAGPDPSPIGQHPPVSHGSAPTPPQASSTSSLRWRGGWEEAGSLEGSLLPVAKLPWGTPLRSDPSLRPSVGRPGGGAAARNWCSPACGWLGPAALPAPAGPPRAGVHASGWATFSAAGAWPRARGPHGLPPRDLCWSDSEVASRRAGRRPPPLLPAAPPAPPRKH